jgi:hypothetical protein
MRRWSTARGKGLRMGAGQLAKGLGVDTQCLEYLEAVRRSQSKKIVLEIKGARRYLHRNLDDYRVILERIAAACRKKAEPKSVWEERRVLACFVVLEKGTHVWSRPVS